MHLTTGNRPGTRLAEVKSRGWRGWPASYPIIQAPNAPLVVAILAMAGSVLTSGDTSDVLTAMSRVALAAWAYKELTEGVNAFRRVLGLGFLVYLVAALATHQ